MPRVKIETIATITMSRYMDIPDDEWNEIKDNHELLAFQVDTSNNDTMEMLSNEFHKAEVIKPKG